MTAVGRASSQLQSTIEHYLGISCVVHDDESPVPIMDNLFKFVGAERVERLRQLVQEKIKTVFAAHDIGLEVDNDPVESFPFITSDMLVTITQHWTAGMDPLA